MKVAITGGAGFIGANLVRALRAAEPGWQIAVIDNLSTGSRANLRGARSHETRGGARQSLAP